MNGPTPVRQDIGPGGEPIEWYRPDPRGKLWRAWGVGTALVVAGAGLGVTLFSFQHLGIAVQVAMTVLALVSTAAGPILVLRAAFSVLSDETCLILHSDGVVYTDDRQRFFVAWDDLVDTAYDGAADALRFSTEEGEHTIERPHFTDIGPVELVERVDAVRRKALLNIFRG